MMTAHRRFTGPVGMRGAPRCCCGGGPITRATSKGFICEQCWRGDPFRPERVAEIVKRFDDACGPERAARYAGHLSNYFDAIEDAIQAKDCQDAALILWAKVSP